MPVWRSTHAVRMRSRWPVAPSVKTAMCLLQQAFYIVFWFAMRLAAASDSVQL